YASSVHGSSQTTSNLWAPFASKMDWKVARWAKLHRSGSTAVSELLSIEGLQDKLNLSYKNIDELNKIVDTKLPQWPIFQHCVARAYDEKMEMWMYHDMHIGDWWWKMQFPKFGPHVSPEWTSASVLDDCDMFYVNPFSNRFPYLTIY
ncbi:hypothetical protein AN958_01554, partial [Leucoagaricus sp. SymC.cos]